ncbi:craniofacial development protein 2-like [Telopea speciosissima]|uniref:craniofacial development protein 2-like n=1 Tax=Telopea speciosissima TaxID=54955 RepID=UPI001CC3DAE2|nr:craniofacial development protein 2-like [Telopea speciosissima]
MSFNTNYVRKRRIRFASWNIGSLTGKSMELIDVMRRRRINVACIQETRWKGHKAKALDDYKLWYLGDDSGRGGVGIVVDKDLKNEVVDVKRVGDRIISIRLVLDNEVINIVSAYAPQAGLDESVKIQFWEHMDGLVQSFGLGEKIIIGGDLNRHVGRDRRGYEEVHRGYGVGERNEEGISVLDFAIAFDLCIANTFFEKRHEHLLTYKSGQHASQIDFFLTRRSDKLLCKNCKVIPGESLTTQHRLMVLDMHLSTRQRRKEK